MGVLLALPTNRLERLARDKHSGLLLKSVNYGRNKFYDTGPRFSTVGNEEISFETLTIAKDRLQLLEEYREQKRLQREAEAAKAKPAFRVGKYPLESSKCKSSFSGNPYPR